MMEIAAFICVGLLVASVLVRGYTVRTMSQLRRDCSMLIHEEKRLRLECEQAEIMQESAEALRNQTRYDVDKYRSELAELQPQIQRTEADLRKVRESASE